MEQQKPKILVLIPAFNEEEQIATTVAEVRKEISEAMVLVVNDGSADQTALRAAAAGAKVLTHPFNLGYGVALQTGYKYARKYGFDYVLQMDGDGQHDPRSIRTLLKELQRGKADVIIGSRFMEGDYEVPFLRRIGMNLFGFIAGCFCGQRITDPTSGYQALGRRALELYVSDCFPGDYPDADVLVMLHRVGLCFQEVPVSMYPNRQGKSMHNGLKPFYYIYKMLLSIGLTLLRSRKSYGTWSRKGPQ
jgi:glycosyltransferase involved in cell wall biosynthesis